MTIFNDTSQRAAYNLSIDERGNDRNEQVRVGMLKLKTDGTMNGLVQPIASGMVDVPDGESVDVSISAHEAAVLEFQFKWAAAGAGVAEPRFPLTAFGGGVEHIVTSKEGSDDITDDPAWDFRTLGKKVTTT